MDIQVNIGDRVRFLNTTGGGIVRKVLRSSGVVYVEDESGFEIPVLHNEVVKVEDGATIVPPVSAKKQEAPATTAVQPQRKSTYQPVPKRGSDPSGELLNITLCYLPRRVGASDRATTRYSSSMTPTTISLSPTPRGAGQPMSSDSRV